MHKQCNFYHVRTFLLKSRKGTLSTGSRGLGSVSKSVRNSRTITPPQRRLIATVSPQQNTPSTTNTESIFHIQQQLSFLACLNHSTSSKQHPKSAPSQTFFNCYARHELQQTLSRQKEIRHTSGAQKKNHRPPQENVRHH